MPTDRDFEQLRSELARQAAALYVAANGFARELFNSDDEGRRAMLDTHTGQVFGRQLGRFRLFLVSVAPELGPIVEQLAAGDDVGAQLDALSAPPAPPAPPAVELPAADVRDVAGQAPLFPGASSGGFGLSLKQAGAGLPDVKRGGRGR